MSTVFDSIMNLESANTSLEVELEPEIAAINLESVEVLPDSEDPMDALLTLTHENDMFMQRLNMAIISEEYAYLRENGVEMVWEENGLTRVIKRFVQWVKDQWAKFTKAVKTLFSRIDSIVRDDAKYVEKVQAKLKANPVADVSMNGYDPAMLRVNSLVSDLSKNYKTVADSVAGLQSLMHSAEVGLNDNISLKKLTKSGKDEGYHTKAGAQQKLAAKDQSQVVEKVENAVKSVMEERKNRETTLLTKQKRSYKVQDAIACLANFAKNKAMLQKNYDDVKRTTDEALKQAKSWENYAKKVYGKDSDDAKGLHACVAGFQKAINGETKLFNSDVRFINKGRSLARAVLSHAVGGKGVAESTVENTNESVFDTIMAGAY